MSEFISVCPKCRQQILCDTAYIGKRIACPVCLQEITMPEPPQRAAQYTPNPATPAAPQTAAAPKRKPNTLKLAALGAAVVILAGAGTILAFRKNSTPKMPATPLAAAAARTPSAPVIVPPTVPSSAPAQKPAPTSTATQDPCRAIWTFDQEGGDTVTDSTGNGNNATLVGDKATWSKAAKVGSGALSLSSSSYAEVPGAVINTARSFTVSAWVNIAAMDKQHNQTVVSIDGNEISGFFLMLYHSGPRFVFNRSDSDDKTATRTMAAASSIAVPNKWYHLAGVYDADAKTLSLYVNGNLEQTVPYDKGWQAAGKTAIGRGFYGHANVDFVNGTIDDVRLYSSALTADEIKKIAE